MRFLSYILLPLSLVLGQNIWAQYDNQRIVSSYYEFEEGSTEYLYGNNVVFRSEPSASSESMDTLSIGQEIQILQKMDKTAQINGLDWNWYKVKIGRKTGYISGGLIALDRVVYDDVVYLVTMAGIDRSSGDYEYTEYRVRTRVIRADGEYYGHESKLNTNAFYLEAFGSKGVKGVDNMLRINLFAEACGVDGGEIYLFNTGERLIEAANLSRVSDAGAFWFVESLTFPEDENGYQDVVIYEREFGESMDESMNWTKATTHTLILKWEDDHFSPNIEEFEFGEDE